MISYTAFKKQFTVGMRLEVEHHIRPEISGPRIVTKVQSNAIVMQPTDRPEVKGGWWMHWPKADRALVIDDDTLQILEDAIIASSSSRPGDPMVTYRIVR